MKVAKAVTKIYVVENNKNTVCAEVVNGCGCGFDALIRIKPKYRDEPDVFAQCIKYSPVSLKDITNKVFISYFRDYMEECYKRECLYGFENIALLFDDII